MEISIKDTLRTLRQKKNVTQEALANHLGITPQSVGKWERGEGFPDITLLPAIALYFGVTVDELLNVDQVRIDEKIKAYQDKSFEYNHNGETEKNLELWEEAYREFPNDCRVLSGLMYAINRGPIYPIPRDMGERKIALGLRILEESSEQDLREKAIQVLAYTYNELGDKENALKYADMAASPYITSAGLRESILDGEEGVTCCQENIARSIQSAAFSAIGMTSKIDMTPEEEIAAYRFAIDLYALLYSDGNVGFYAVDLSWFYHCMARCYALLTDADRCIDALKKAAEYAIKSDTREKTPYTAPMVNRLVSDPSKTTKNHKSNTCAWRLDGMKWNCFDFIRSDERFCTVTAQLEKYAEQAE